MFLSYHGDAVRVCAAGQRHGHAAQFHTGAAAVFVYAYSPEQQGKASYCALSTVAPEAEATRCARELRGVQWPRNVADRQDWARAAQGGPEG